MARLKIVILYVCDETLKCTKKQHWDKTFSSKMNTQNMHCMLWNAEWYLQPQMLLMYQLNQEISRATAQWWLLYLLCNAEVVRSTNTWNMLANTKNNVLGNQKRDYYELWSMLYYSFEHTVTFKLSKLVKTASHRLYGETR